MKTIKFQNLEPEEQEIVLTNMCKGETNNFLPSRGESIMIDISCFQCGKNSDLYSKDREFLCNFCSESKLKKRRDSFLSYPKDKKS